MAECRSERSDMQTMRPIWPMNAWRNMAAACVLGSALALGGCGSAPPAKSGPAGGNTTLVIPRSVPVFMSGGMLVTSAGMTLYTYDKDVPGSGQSQCNGNCAMEWPPLRVVSGTPAGEFAVITREGGAEQWTYKGKPLYQFSGDANPNDTNGDGVNGVWHIARP